VIQAQKNCLVYIVLFCIYIIFNPEKIKEIRKPKYRFPILLKKYLKAEMREKENKIT